eukprot:CAMPEP_0172564950 /NCGR_PEP_ID=MMETSP1067-20121228/106313_1 /TAXON_ID=265564 ORGANISM="Thalassiosira punctigera, Strain Tpunct2005C2" /NCGR_SAMPLE_ID=MMETSP1067 /ASSEMBLY_ACC=CAM_ASM_000444 /LENGTH=256 /DNA_ID=CAMNT_0013355745 /DNA_START=62 /DNA_END=832 /DNA_ORIENTATION=+
MHQRHIPISVAFYCPKSIVFVPLLAELGAELGRFKESERGGLTCLFQSVFAQLICNNTRREDLEDESWGYIDDEASAAIMMRLKEKGLMKKEDIFNYDLTNLLLYNAIYRESYRIDKRFRFLIDWDPSILSECGRSKPLLCHYVCRMCTTIDGSTPHGAAQRFQTILKSGLSHYPNELGFLFRGTTFHLACNKFGQDEVSRIIDAELFGPLGQNSKKNNNTLRALVSAAATNDDISLDGVHTMLRRDPIGLLPRLL